MNRQAILEWASRDPSARWGAGAAVAVLWTAVAWTDAKILIALPFVAAALAVLYVRRRDQLQAVDEDADDWL